MAKDTAKPKRRRSPEAEEREYYRGLPGASGAVQRAVWGNDEADFERMVEHDVAVSRPRPHIFLGKVRRRWSS